MRLPQRGPDRPPRGVAGPSTPPVVTGLLAPASPEDSRSRGGDVRKDGGRWRSLSDRDGLTGSEWCADPCLLRAGAWQSNASRGVDIPFSGGPLAGPLAGRRSVVFSYQSADPYCASDCLETAIRWIFSASGASARVV